ncbi:MAG: LytTR family DNA-binding domain-containing protein [Mariniphaga sp.]
MIIKCLAIDDEPLAVKKIASYIQKTPFLELVGECRNAFEAIDLLNQLEVQLLFVDINMPELNGMEFVKSLINKPYVVFTTAYSEYAVEGFKVDAVDYLLKPVDYTSFLKAATKVKNLIDLKSATPVENIKATSDHLFVKSEYKLVRIDLDDITYIESQHEYIKINLVNRKPVMTMVSMKAIEDQLPADRFMRVHRSFIVNLKKITVIERNRILFDDKVLIPVSDQYKEKFQRYIDEFFI